MKVLLVEPKYKSKYPPLGLLKLSAIHKKNGDEVEFVEGVNIGVTGNFERIYVTSLWTWAWDEVWQCVRYYKRMFPDSDVWLGGIYASVMPEHAEKSGADYIHTGLCEKAENIKPDYDILPYDWDSSILFATRGCKSKCKYCLVPKVEGDLKVNVSSIRNHIEPDHNKIVFFDNDILSSPNLSQIFKELKELGKKVDFNQGLKASRINKDIAKKLAELKLVESPKIRIGYDSLSESKPVKKAIENLKAAGFNGRDILTYNLYNFQENPDQFLKRVENTLNWGASSYPMRYRPLDSLNKNEYIGHGWTRNKMEMVERARRVIGYGGAFPPYEGLVKKINNAQDFYDAFKEFSENGGRN